MTLILLLANFLLLLISIVLALIFFPVGIVFTAIASVNEGTGRKALGYLSSSARSVAIAIDILANTVCADLFSNTMRKAGICTTKVQHNEFRGSGLTALIQAIKIGPPGVRYPSNYLNFSLL